MLFSGAMTALVTPFKNNALDEEAYRDIFHRLQEENYFDFEIKHRRFSDY